jgi:hypothetical protein
MARCGWFPVAVHRSTRLGSGSVARPDPRSTPLTAHGRSLFQTGTHVCALRAVRRRPTRSRFAPGAEPPAAERGYAGDVDLRASSLYSLAWVQDSDKLPHSARGQHVDVHRMISARLRVPPLWCRVRAGITRSTREDLSAQARTDASSGPLLQDGSPHLPSALALAQQWWAPAESWCRPKDDCRATRCSSE